MVANLTTRMTYRATCERVDGWWAISVDGVRGAHTQTRRLATAASTAREAVALLKDVDEAAIEIELDIKLPPEIGDILAQLHARQEAAESAQRMAAEAQAKAATALVASGFTLRDAGEVLGLSFQRVGQLVGRRKAN